MRPRSNTGEDSVRDGRSLDQITLPFLGFSAATRPARSDAVRWSTVKYSRPPPNAGEEAARPPSWRCQTVLPVPLSNARALARLSRLYRRLPTITGGNSSRSGTTRVQPFLNGGRIANDAG